MKKFLIISKKKWKKENFNFFNNKKEFIFLNKIDINKINKIKPKIIFFLFWSKKITKEIFSNYLCIQFHSSNLPKFRGGSPIQNQILNKMYKTKLSAFKINNILDGGDICMKSDISLIGNAKDIYINIEKKALEMIKKISKKKKITFKKQSGIPSFYLRRNASQSNIKYVINKKENAIYDYIRMLDAEGYPRVFLKLGNKKIEFYEASYKRNLIFGKFLIKKI